MLSCCHRMFWSSNPVGPSSHTPLKLQYPLSFLHMNARSGTEQGSVSAGWHCASGFYSTGCPRLCTGIWLPFVQRHKVFTNISHQDPDEDILFICVKPNCERALASLCLLWLHRRAAHKTREETHCLDCADVSRNKFLIPYRILNKYLQASCFEDLFIIVLTYPSPSFICICQHCMPNNLLFL